jgi:hypothetical protein
VIPLDYLESPLRELNAKSLVLFTLNSGGSPTDVYLTEVLVIFACVGFIALAVLLQWRWYLYYGLVHLSIHLTLFTGKHLQDHLSWPLALLIVGTLTMLISAALEVWYGRLRGERKEPGRTRSSSNY